MQDDLIRKIAQSMAEQTAAFTKLESMTQLLIVALTLCDPLRIEAISRTAEAELFRMRSRLLEITSDLSTFSEERAKQTESQPLDAGARTQFESDAKKLLKVARGYEKVVARADSLAIGGMSYASANIQMCGIPASTYNAPVLRSNRGVFV